MAADLLILPSRALSSAGVPLSGAKLHTYVTGTSTPQSVYTTSALNVAHANPVVADAGGNFAPIYFNSAQTYRVKLTDSTGAVTVFDVDPFTTGALAQLAASGGSAIVGFLQSGVGAVARTAQDKLREAPFTPEDFGAVGNNSTDDTLAIRKAFTAAADGGTVQLKSGTTYKTTGQIDVLPGIRFNMNEAKIRAVLNGDDDAAVQIYANSIVENGHIEVDSTNCNSPQAGSHAPVRVGNPTSAGGTPDDPNPGENPSGWIIRNMILESDKFIDRGDGQFVGSAGIQVYGGANNGVIDGITIPDNDFMFVGVAMDWSHLGTIDSADTFANMNTNRSNFNAGTAYTTHPNNITARNIKIGALTAAMVPGEQDIGSFGVRLSGCYNILVENVDVESVTYQAFTHTAGDLGFEFALSSVKPLACKNIVFRNCTVRTGSTANIVYSDSLADNVSDASRTAVFTGAIAGSTLTVSAVTSGTLAVGHSVYNGDNLVGVISALGTGTGGTGTYTLTGAVTTSSTTLNSGYGWLMNPLHETNIVFEKIVAKGPGNATVSYGGRFLQQRGGAMIDCDFSYFDYGIQVDDRGQGIKLIRPHVHYCQSDGIFIHHTTNPPRDVVIEDPWVHDNGQDSGFSDPAGVHIGTSDRTKLIRGRYGNAGGTEATQKFGWRLGSGANDAVVTYPEVLAYKSGGGESYIQSTDFSLTLRTLSQVAPLTVATLPAAASTLIGARAVVTDSNAALTAGIGAVVAGGGANKVPVFCDGSNWRIG